MVKVNAVISVYIDDQQEAFCSYLITRVTGGMIRLVNVEGICIDPNYEFYGAKHCLHGIDANGNKHRLGKMIDPVNCMENGTTGVAINWYFEKDRWIYGENEPEFPMYVSEACAKRIIESVKRKEKVPVEHMLKPSFVTKHCGLMALAKVVAESGQALTTTTTTVNMPDYKRLYDAAEKERRGLKRKLEETDNTVKLLKRNRQSFLENNLILIGINRASGGKWRFTMRKSDSIGVIFTIYKKLKSKKRKTETNSSFALKWKENKLSEGMSIRFSEIKVLKNASSMVIQEVVEL